jgi:hypothetical protein
LQVYECPLNFPGKISIQELQYRVLEATLKAQQEIEIITTQLQTRQESLVHIELMKMEMELIQEKKAAEEFHKLIEL